MTGFYYGDPYFPVGGTAGWIEEDEDQHEEIMAGDKDDGSSDDSSDEEESEEEEDPEEEPMEEDPLADNVHAECIEQEIDEMIGDIESNAVIVILDEETDPEPDSGVDDPRYTIRSLTDPLPPPSFQVYRHPGGPLWKYTPRKSIPPVRPHDVFTFTMTSQGVGIGSGSMGAGTSAAGVATADGVQPDLFRDVTRPDTQTYATDRRLLAMDADLQVTHVRVRRIDVKVDCHDKVIDELQDDLATAHQEIAVLRGQLASVDEAARDAVRLAQQALSEERAFRRRLAAFYQLPPGC